MGPLRGAVFPIELQFSDPVVTRPDTPTRTRIDQIRILASWAESLVLGLVRWSATHKGSLSTIWQWLGRSMRAIASSMSQRGILAVWVVLLVCWSLYASPWGFKIWWAFRPWTLR